MKELFQSYIELRRLSVLVCSFVKLTIKQTKTLIFRDRCLSLFYGVLFPLKEVQRYSRRYAQKLACDGVIRKSRDIQSPSQR